MQPVIAFPYHDPDLQMLPHLQVILPDLKALFKQAYICPPPDTAHHAGLMDWLNRDNFFTIFPLGKQLQIGAHFAYLYFKAAQAADPEDVIHMAYVDRLSFALEGKYRKQFIEDIKSLQPADLPLIFQRSAQAWDSHPTNYRQIEGFVTTIGEILYGKTLDYAWCHLVVKAGQLVQVMPKVRNADLSMVTEMILLLQSNIKAREVDWLAWEDPFVFGCEPEKLKQERENDPEETRKRLAYALPMVETLVRFSKGKEITDVPFLSSPALPSRT